MITNKDLSVVELSPVKTDFYQIWNELMDVATKISERWDPSSTNENDPGIVLLKVLTAIADKLDYNIDKNILEAFMPSAAQKESMRKLCNMLGYNMKYYQSAETAVTFIFNKKDDNGQLAIGNEGLLIPLFTNVTNADKDVNYITTEAAILTKEIPNKEIICIEGQLVQCENDNDNIISLEQLDDQFRYYLPEAQVAENGVFVYNISDQVYSDRWRKVDNLNIQSAQSQVYKFGYDSKEGLPYIQFAEDVAEIIEDGFVIYYVRTSGVNGNISAKVLSTFEAPSDWDGITADDFTVTNKNAAQNGCNEESNTAAYNNFKKTIGTFDTLVTCRDYMNKIYQLMDDQNIPLCSNVVVADIRDDINRAVTLCSFNEYGICYVDKSTKETKLITGKEVNTGVETTIKVSADKLDHFDLMLYPFKTVYGLNTKSEYKNSFKYTETKNNEIKADIADYKTIAHQFKSPDIDEIACIKNYLKLNAKITTTTKVNAAEEALILANVRKAIYEAFNMRQLDFGEEIPFDSILEVIEGADARIKNVSLDEPELYTRIMLADNTEYDIASTANTEISTSGNNWKTLYNKLALRNILAGRVELFKYDRSFKYNYDETVYTDDNDDPVYPGILPEEKPNKHTGIYAIEPHCDLPITAVSGQSYSESPELAECEVVQFKAPNFVTTKTYSTYVNYYFHTNISGGVQAIPATFTSIYDFLNSLNAQQKLDLGKDLGMYTQSSTVGHEEYEPSWEAKYPTTWSEIPNNYELFGKLAQSLKKRKRTDGRSQSNGLYRVVNRSTNLQPSYLIDNDGLKYQICTKNTTAAYLFADENYYIPELHDADVPGTHTADGLGKDGEAPSVKKNSEYQLTGDEFLFINYTESAEGSEDKVSKNILYVAPAIIKPNFDLIDTSNSTRTRTKKPDSTEFDVDGAEIMPKEHTGSGSGASAKVTDSEHGGLLSLGAQEQIEIRNFSRVVFKTGTNFYLASSKRELATLKQGENILEDGEYLYYTDTNKIDFAYFGPGTGVYLPAAGSVLFTPADTDLSAADILAQGISVIPFQFYRPSSTASLDTDYIYAQEYQYLTLAKGDKIKQINVNVASLGFTSSVVNNEIVQGNKWHAVDQSGDKKCVYILDGTEGTLPKIAVDTFGWEVRSLLTLKASADQAQTLQKEYDHVDLYAGEMVTATEYEDYQYYLTHHDDPQFIYHWLENQFKFLVDTNEQYDVARDGTRTAWSSADCTLVLLTQLTPILESGEPKPLSFKINYLADIVNDLAITQVATYDDSEEEKKVTAYYNDFKLKDYYSQEVLKDGSDPVTLNNLNTNWTSVPLAAYTTRANHMDISVNIPNEQSRGLLMIYYTTELTEADNKSYGAYLVATDSAGQSVNLKIFNNGEVNKTGSGFPFESTWTWWSGYTIDNDQVLKKGLNVIWLDKSCTLEIHGVRTDDHINAGTIVFSDLDLVNISADNDYGFNLDRLGYKALVSASGTEATVLDQIATILSSIQELDPDYEFYYNCVLDNSNAIDFNDNLSEGELEALDTPKIWYDANNINNKFVISEIDADYLEKGIVVAKTSKLK